jgi:hypothetical protein
MKGQYYKMAARLVQPSDRLTDARLHQRVEELDAAVVVAHPCSQ